MVSRVALVKTDEGVLEAYQHALGLLGGIEDLDGRNITIKVGIFDQRNLNYPSVQVVKAVADSFVRSQKIRLAESDNYQGKALDRLQVWNTVFSSKVIPFSLSNDSCMKEVSVCGERIRFSCALFKPNVLVSLHILRKGQAGSIFKNLLGLVPDIKKDRFHNNLGDALVDMAQAVGWIDLAVIDGTYSYGGEWKEGIPLEKERKDCLIVGRDPVAVETIGSLIVGEDPLSIPAMVVAKERRLGETNPDKIKVLGEPLKKII